MSESIPDRFQLVSHSQYDTAYLCSELASCAVDWQKALAISKLANAINAEPYRSWDFLQHLPYYNRGLNMTVSGTGQTYEMVFPDSKDENERAIYRATRLLVEAKCAIYAFMSLQLRTQDNNTSPQVIRLFGTVSSVDQKMNRGNRWMSVASEIETGANQLLDWRVDAQDDTDKDVMAAVQQVLMKMVKGVDETMKGVDAVDEGLGNAVRYVNTLSGKLRSNCQQISSLAGSLQPQDQHRFIFDWAKRVGSTWGGNDLSQLDIFINGWTRIQSNLITVKTLGAAIQKKFADAIQATKDRIVNPTAPTNADGLHHLYITLGHTIRTQAQAWIKAVEEILLINWQYFDGKGIGQNPMQKLFMADLDPVLGLPG